MSELDVLFVFCILNTYIVSSWAANSIIMIAVAVSLFVMNSNDDEDPGNPFCRSQNRDLASSEMFGPSVMLLKATRTVEDDAVSVYLFKTPFVGTKHEIFDLIISHLDFPPSFIFPNATFLQQHAVVLCLVKSLFF